MSLYICVFVYDYEIQVLFERCSWRVIVTTAVGWVYLWQVAALNGLTYDKATLPVLKSLVSDCEKMESDKEGLRKAGI